MQHWIQIVAILDFIEVERIGTFIELGLDAGGLGGFLYMRTRIVDSFHYVGFEIDFSKLDSRYRIYLQKYDPFLDNRFQIKNLDVFTYRGKDAVLNYIRSSGGPVLLFCDNGNKARELQIYSPQNWLAPR